MAITTQAQYRGHILAMFKTTISNQPRLLIPLLPSLVEYARAGVDHREAVEMFLTWAWQHIQGGSFDGHRFKHLLMDAGVPAHIAEDITQRTEP